MSFRMRAVVATGIAAATALTGTVLIDASSASAAGAPRTVLVRMTKQHVRLSQAHVHAGTILFNAVSRDGRAHEMQVIRLLHGYTLKQAESDLGKAFSGKVKAVRRIDHNIAFRGGTPARKSGKPGSVVISLTAGHYYVIDQDGNGLASLHVRGKAGHQSAVPHQGMITANSYGFQSANLPSSGFVKMRNISDQPHFIAIQRVKQSTRPRQVGRFAQHPSNRRPSWLLRANTDSGVISPYRHEVLRYNLPAGKYLLACFWPDDDTGMPHFYMGMWKLVHIG